MPKAAKIFHNGKSQAVSLPKEFHFKGDKVFIKKIGSAVILFAAENPWEPLLDSLNRFSSDFGVKKQPVEQQREDFE